MPISTLLLDLDNTIYPSTAGVMQSVDTRITAYVQQLLGLELADAMEVRHRYFSEYGTTLRGLQENHGVDADDYLAYVHDLALESFLASDAELDRLLGQLPLEKVIFTNATAEHARRVLEILGIAPHFARIFDIRSYAFVPKPNPAVYQFLLDTLGVDGAECVFVEDTAQNLLPARALGMTTILIGAEPHADHVADYTVPDILAALRVVRGLLAA